MMNDEITINLILNEIVFAILMGIAASGFSAIAMGIGFIQSSVSTTIVSAVILSMAASNILSLTNMTILLNILLIFGIVGLALLVIRLIDTKISRLEVWR